MLLSSFSFSFSLTIRGAYRVGIAQNGLFIHKIIILEIKGDNADRGQGEGGRQRGSNERCQRTIDNARDAPSQEAMHRAHIRKPKSTVHRTSSNRLAALMFSAEAFAAASAAAAAAASADADAEAVASTAVVVVVATISLVFVCV